MHLLSLFAMPSAVGVLLQAIVNEQMDLKVACKFQSGVGVKLSGKVSAKLCTSFDLPARKIAHTNHEQLDPPETKGPKGKNPFCCCLI